MTKVKLYLPPSANSSLKNTVDSEFQILRRSEKMHRNFMVNVFFGDKKKRKEMFGMTGKIC